MIDVNSLLARVVEVGASDLHLTVGVPPVVRVKGKLERLDGFDVLGVEALEGVVGAILTDEYRRRFEETGDFDRSFGLAGVGRFRVNAFRQRGSPAFCFRVIQPTIPSFESLGLPEILIDLCGLPDGLVLITGPTGSGKSTTLAAMIDHINRERAAVIITVEDPIEYLHRHNKSLVNQREVGSDTASFATSLRAALREDPDVIMVGEMRDTETIETALRAAETGHLVFSTLHTSGAASTIERIVDSFSPHRQQQVRVQLAGSLRAVVWQQLVPRIDGGVVAACEVMVATPAIRNLIREGRTFQINSTIETGSRFGMQTMEQVLARLAAEGVISDEVTARYER